jgi:hypothetical protein
MQEVFLIKWVQTGGVRCVCDTQATADKKLDQLRKEGDKDEYEIKARLVLTEGDL